MKKFTDEELSRILSACAANMLLLGGSYDFNDEHGCINQVAYNEPREGAAMRLNLLAAKWFDDLFRNPVDPDELLAALEENGFA